MAVRPFVKTWKKMLTGASGVKLNGDLRLLLVMTNTTCDTDDIDTVEFLDDFTTLDEADGAGYARVALSSATPAVAASASRHSVQLTCTDHPVFENLDAGTRNIQGVLLYINVLGDDSQSMPLLYFPYTTPRVPDGGDFTIELNSDKMLYEYLCGVATGTTPLDP